MSTPGQVPLSVATDGSVRVVLSTGSLPADAVPTELTAKTPDGAEVPLYVDALGRLIVVEV